MQLTKIQKKKLNKVYLKALEVFEEESIESKRGICYAISKGNKKPYHYTSFAHQYFYYLFDTPTNYFGYRNEQNAETRKLALAFLIELTR